MTKPDSIVFFGYTCSKCMGDYSLKLGGPHWGVSFHIFTGRESTEKYSCTLSYYNYSAFLKGDNEGFEWRIRTDYYSTLKELESRVLEILGTMGSSMEDWKHLNQPGSGT